MNLEDLTRRERHELAVFVTLACVRRLEAMACRCDPDDVAVHRLVEELARKAFDRTEELETFRVKVLSMGSSRLTRKVLEGLIRDHFPSFSRPLGRGPLDREAATTLAEGLEEECAGFYLALAEGLEEGDSRDLFLSLGRQDRSFLDFVRQVLL